MKDTAGRFVFSTSKQFIESLFIKEAYTCSICDLIRIKTWRDQLNGCDSFTISFSLLNNKAIMFSITKKLPLSQSVHIFTKFVCCISK